MIIGPLIIQTNIGEFRTLVTTREWKQFTH